MYIDLAGIRKAKGGRVEVHLQLEPAEPFRYAGTEAVFASPIDFNAEMVNTGAGIHASIHASGALTLNCDRCLVSYDWPFTIDYQELYLTPEEAVKMPPEGDSETRHVVASEPRVDPMEGLREALIVVLPMKNLCSEGCKGLCAICGGNLNERVCNCSHEEVDPRLEVLKTLLGKME